MIPTVNIPETLFLRHMEELAHRAGQMRAERLAREQDERQRGYQLQDQSARLLQQENAKNEAASEEVKQARMDAARARGTADSLDNTSSDQEITDPEEALHYQVGKALGNVKRRELESKQAEQNFLASLGYGKAVRVADINAGAKQGVESSKEKSENTRQDKSLTEKAREADQADATRRAAIRARGTGAASEVFNAGGNKPQGALTSGIDEEYMKTLPLAEQTMIRAIHEGRQKAPTTLSMRNPVGAKLMADLARAAPGFDVSQAAVREKTRVGFDTGKQGESGAALTMLNQHLNNYDKYADAFGGTNNKFLNAIGVNKVRAEGLDLASDPDAANLDAAAIGVSKEYDRLTSGTGGTSHEETLAIRKLFEKGRSPAYKHAAAAAVRHLAEGRAAALNAQQSRGFALPEESPQPVSIGGTQSAQPSETRTIKVRHKTTGKTGTATLGPGESLPDDVEEIQ